MLRDSVATKNTLILMLKGQPWLGTTQKKQAAVEVRNLGSKAHLVAGKPLIFTACLRLSMTVWVQELVLLSGSPVTHLWG